MKRLNELSTKEILEHLLVGYSKDQLIEVLDNIQSEWDQISTAEWERRIKKIEGVK